MSPLIFQSFRCFTYVTAHFITLPLIHLRHSSFSNSPVTSPTSQLILQLFCRFTYVTAHSPTLPLFHLLHRSFSNPSFASSTSQALHLRHLANRPCLRRLSTSLCSEHTYSDHSWVCLPQPGTKRRDVSRGRNPENGRRRDFGRRRHRQSEFQHTDRLRPSSAELFNKNEM